jgi:molybdopterin-guanine dinucleotide biosynthesis protein A
VPDRSPAFAGPLAGLHAALATATHPLVATAPCDSPFLPADLPHLTEFLESGGRKVDRWYSTLNIVEVAFDDEADAFENINTHEELGRFEAARNG